MNRHLHALACGALCLLAASAAEIEGLGSVGEVVKLHGGFTFTEGPAADAQGSLYFTDVRESRIRRVGTDGQLSVFLEETQGCNGLMFDSGGKLYACQGGAGRIIRIDPATKAIEVVCDQYQGNRFGRPNDLALDASGGVYFTDPGGGQTPGAVYYCAADRTVSRVINDLARPNGVLVAPDGKTLYVLPSGTPAVMAYAIEATGKLGPARKLCDLVAPDGTASNRGGDGLTADSQGNLFVTVPGSSAIMITTAEGKVLGHLRVPESPSNCAFGGADRKTLFITARTSLYTVAMPIAGP